MRYFFHLADGDRDPDNMGIELPDDDSAKAAAVRYAAQLLQDDPIGLWHHGQWRVEVCDEHGVLRWLIISMAIDAPTPDEYLESRGTAGFNSV